MKTKLTISVAVLGVVYFTTNHYHAKHSTEIFALAVIMLLVFFMLWNAPEKHKDHGPNDQDEDLRAGDGAPHP